MAIERVERIDDPRLGDYRHLPDPELLRRGEIFMAEGRLVVRTLLAQSPLAARSVLMTENAYRALADIVEPHLPQLPVFLVTDDTIETLTGFNIHRGCLAAGRRPPRRPVADLLACLPGARRLVLLEQIANADNLGGIFRNAAALGANGIVLGPNCCDPLYRKAIRVSMGAALLVPFCHADDWPADLDVVRSAGFSVVALAPAPSSRDVGEWVCGLRPDSRVALLAGSEGHGLSAAALEHAAVAVRIPMAPGIDSLNVATATGIALHACFQG
jgi:tRNA G18 (ribose-2'-O)-methylase SpoU